MVVLRVPGKIPVNILLTEPLEVGRDAPGLLVGDPQVSRRHLELRPIGDGVQVRDLGSTHGTRVDGRPVAEPIMLEPGSVVQFGNSSIMLGGTRQVRAFHGGNVPLTSLERVANAVGSDDFQAAQSRRGRTVTVAFSDIEGSTELASALGDAKWYELLTVHNQLVERAVARHEGRVVKNQGDGFMMAFPSARGAIDALVAMQRDTSKLENLRIRAGAHVGEAITDENGDLFGRHVNLAARVAASAHGGEILVSPLVREIVESRGDLRFGPPRRVDLKGIGRDYEVHPLEWSV